MISAISGEGSSRPATRNLAILALLLGGAVASPAFSRSQVQAAASATVVSADSDAPDRCRDVLEHVGSDSFVWNTEASHEENLDQYARSEWFRRSVQSNQAHGFVEYAGIALGFGARGSSEGEAFWKRFDESSHEEKSRILDTATAQVFPREAIDAWIRCMEMQLGSGLTVESERSSRTSGYALVRHRRMHGEPAAEVLGAPVFSNLVQLGDAVESFGAETIIGFEIIDPELPAWAGFTTAAGVVKVSFDAWPEPVTGSFTADVHRGAWNGVGVPAFTVEAIVCGWSSVEQGWVELARSAASMVDRGRIEVDAFALDGVQLVKVDLKCQRDAVPFSTWSVTVPGRVGPPMSRLQSWGFDPDMPSAQFANGPRFGRLNLHMDFASAASSGQ
jgi:hypothetical protein